MSRTSRPAASALRDWRRIGAQADDDVDAGVLQVEGVRVALGAVAEDRDGLAVKLCEVCIVVVNHAGEVIGREVWL